MFYIVQNIDNRLISSTFVFKSEERNAAGARGVSASSAQVGRYQSQEKVGQSVPIWIINGRAATRRIARYLSGHWIAVHVSTTLTISCCVVLVRSVRNVF